MTVTRVASILIAAGIPFYQLIQKGLPRLIPQVRQQAVAGELGGISKHR